MSVQDAISKAGEDFTKAITHLLDECSRLQVGRANASLVEKISVDVYGTPQPLKNIANIAIPDARTIQIQPWDKSNLGPIEKAISISGIGLNPINDGNLVRIAIPLLTEERRKELTKYVHKHAEEAKITVRNARQDAHNQFKQLKTSGDITEDDLFTADKKLQEKVDEANKKIEEVAVAKEKDVMTI